MGTTPNKEVLNRFRKSGLLGDNTTEIVGYALLDLQTGNIEYYYTRELKDYIASGEIVLSNMTLGRDYSLRYNANSDRLRENSRLAKIYGHTGTEYTTGEEKRATHIYNNIYENIKGKQGFIGNLSFDRVEKEERNQFYILFRNAAFYNFPCINFYNSKAGNMGVGDIAAKIRFGYDVDRNVAMVLLQAPGVTSNYIEGSVESVANFIYQNIKLDDGSSSTTKPNIDTEYLEHQFDVEDDNGGVHVKLYDTKNKLKPSIVHIQSTQVITKQSKESYETKKKVINSKGIFGLFNAFRR